MNIESNYQRFLKLTGNEIAAAILAVGELLPSIQSQDALTPKQAAQSLGVSLDTIYELCRSGRLRSQKVGRAVRIRPADLADYNSDTTAKAGNYRCLKTVG